MAHICSNSGKEKCCQTKCIEITLRNQGKIALNLAQKWLMITHIPADKSVVRQKCIETTLKSKVKLL